MNVENLLEVQMQRGELLLYDLPNGQEVFNNKVFCYPIRSEMHV